jgi:hypothetical protein
MAIDKLLDVAIKPLTAKACNSVTMHPFTVQNDGFFELTEPRQRKKLWPQRH